MALLPVGAPEVSAEGGGMKVERRKKGAAEAMVAGNTRDGW